MARDPSSPPSSSGDRIVRAIAADGTVRVVAVIATELVAEAARRHAASSSVAVAMGRAASAGLLLATLTKDEERLTLQVLGDGPVGSVTVDVSSAGTARAFAKHPQATPPLAAGATGRTPSVRALIGRSGMVSVIRELGLGQPFSGQTPLADGEIDTDVERYLTDSEQTDSALACETVIDPVIGLAAAVGVLVQTLPGSEGATIVADARARLRAGALAGWLRETRTVSGPLLEEGLIRAAVGDEVAATVEILEQRPVRFACPCSRERAAATLAMLGEADLLAMIQEEGDAQVTCEFCRTAYTFTDAELDEIRRALRRSTAAPS